MTKQRTQGWSGDKARFSEADRRAIMRRDPTCRCGGCELHEGQCVVPSAEADHVVPIAEGGANNIANGAGMCADCHLVKSKAEAGRGRARHSRLRPMSPHPGIIQ